MAAEEASCAKCKQNPPKINTRNAQFCVACFKDSVIHRFRANISKCKLFGTGEHVLVGLSGGLSSSTLLHLCKDYHRDNGKKRQRFAKFSVCYVDESALFNESNSDFCRTIAASYGFDFYSVKLEDMCEGWINCLVYLACPQFF